MWAVGLLALGMYCLFAEQAGAGGNPHRPGHGHQAVPGADPWRRPAAGPAHRAGSGPSWSPPAPPPAAWLAVNLPVAALNPAGWRYFYQFTQERPAGYSSPWFAYNLVAGASAGSPGRRSHQRAGPDLFVLACVLIAARGPDGAPAATAGAAGFPDRGRLHPDQQGLLPPVCALADSAAGPRPAAVAGLPGLAGRSKACTGPPSGCISGR